MGGIWTQVFPSVPALTEKNLPAQSNKVFIVTGGASGIGFELSRILYGSGARVYIAGRSESKALDAIASIKSTNPVPPSGAQIHFLSLHLDDLSTIKASAEAFKAKESRLDVLWNNAGIGAASVQPRTHQGIQVPLATNCLGPLLFTNLLLPELRATAQNSASGSVRVIWTSSMTVEFKAPAGGVDFDSLETPTDPVMNYAMTKAGNWFLASELAKRVKDDGIISLTINPGNLKTDVWKSSPKLLVSMLSPVLHESKMGAYTELWAGLAESIGIDRTGGYAIPWGRWHTSPRKDLLEALKTREEGGTGEAARFWNWCEEITKSFM